MLAVNSPLCFASALALLLATNGAQVFAGFKWERWLTAVCVLTATCLHAHRKQSLTNGGILAAALIGLPVALVSLPLLTTLIAFLLIGSKATSAGAIVKARFDAQYNPLGRRKSSQVIANGGVVALIAYLHAIDKSIPLLAGVCAIACALGDTFASELGPLVAKRDKVRLLTRPWRQVPTGSNGGVTLAGSALATLGGALTGVVFAVATWSLSSFFHIVAVSAVAGLFGCTVDSLLGEYLQETRVSRSNSSLITLEEDEKMSKHSSGLRLLDGDMVNLLSTAVTAFSAYMLLSQTDGNNQ